MTVTVKSFALNNAIAGISAATADTIYTAGELESQIVQVTGTNADTAIADVFVYILEPGIAPISVAKTDSIGIDPGETESLTNLIGHVVPPGGTIQAYATTTDVISLTVSGNEYTTE